MEGDAHESLGSGINNVKELLKNLPPQGIAIQGTTSERAHSIVEKGFLPNEEKPTQKDGTVYDGTYFYHLKPLADEKNAKKVVGSILKAIEQADGWGRTSGEYSKGGNGEDVSLVVFVPPEEPQPYHYHQGTTEDTAYGAFLPYGVHKDWILGSVDFPKRDIKERYIGRPGEVARMSRASDALRGIAGLVESKRDKIEELESAEHPRETKKQTFIEKLKDSSSKFGPKRALEMFANQKK